MSKALLCAAALLLSTAVWAEDTNKTLPEVTSTPNNAVTIIERKTDANGEVIATQERETDRSLSTIITKGEDGKGLNMQERWSDDVVVCKRQKVAGSRITRKVCHTRGQWQAMRVNARDALEASVREALLYGVDGG